MLQRHKIIVFFSDINHSHWTTQPAWDCRNHSADHQQTHHKGFRSQGGESRQTQGRDKTTCHLEVVRQNNCQVTRLMSRLSWYPRDYLFCLTSTIWTLLILTRNSQIFFWVFSSTGVHFLCPSPCFGEEEVKDALINTQLCWQCQQGAHGNLPTG